MADDMLSELLFHNPLNLPLEKLYLKIKKVTGGEEQVKALDKFWVAERCYPCYSPIPKIESTDNKEKWLKRADNYINSLHYILNLPYYKFLSYVLYEPAVPAMMESFFQNAEPCYFPHPCDEYKQPYSTIYNLVFRIYKRILTPKQSDTEFITPDVLGKLLKDSNVITYYIMWDICKLYGHADDGTIVELFEFAYEVVPKLKDELVLITKCMGQIFEAIGTAAYEDENPTEELITKLTLLLYDTAFAINIFMQIYTPFKDLCIKEKFFDRIVHAYDFEVRILYDVIQNTCISEDDPAHDRTDNARVEMLQCCHNLTSYCLNLILLETEKPCERNKWVETYLSLIAMIVDHKFFLSDFDKCFPINQDIEMLKVIYPEVDKEKCDSITSIIEKHWIEENKLNEEEKIFVNEQNEQELLDEDTVPEQVVLESQITELLDMFPNLGDGFLEQCLIEMKLDSQKVLMAIIEDNLPPNLAALDRTMPRIPPELPEPEPGPSTQEMYIAKAPQYSNANELLDDKSDIDDVKKRILAFRQKVYDVYDDDYDEEEGYDYVVGGIDCFDPEEVRKPRTFGRSESEDEHEEAEDTDEAKPPSNAFCEDPALIRARREARYQQNRRGPPPTNRNKDVVGKPKGQGQDKQVQQNRDKKNINKSSRGNHNRRQGAQWKRSRGMFPS